MGPCSGLESFSAACALAVALCAVRYSCLDALGMRLHDD